MGRVILIGTLDTKGAEYEYLRACLREAGAEVTLIDVGVLGEPGAVADIGAAEVAEAGGAPAAKPATYPRGQRHARRRAPPRWGAASCAS